MSTINVEQIQQNPSEFLGRLAAGENLVIVRDGQAVAEINPVTASRSSPRPYGLARGEFVVPDDFDSPLPEDILRDFEGT